MNEVLSFIASNLPMLICLIVGIVLLVLEAFMPGFGVAGFSGAAMEVAALVLCWFNLGPAATLGLLLIILSVLAISVSMSLRSLAKGRLSESAMVLRDTESNDEGYRSSSDMESFVGLVGTATTVLRPTGNAEFDGVRLNVVSEGDFIPCGAQVKVIRVEGGKILVRTA